MSYLCSIMVALLAAGGVQETPSASDEQIQRRVEQRLEDEGLREIQVVVDGGAVTLTGEVESAWERANAVQVAHEVAGVTTVTANLSVPGVQEGERLIHDVSRRINNYVYYTIFDIVRARAEQGVVTLEGKVTDPFKKNEIGRMVSRVAGVQEVNNQIEVLPASIYDEQIRYAVANRIFGDPFFERYAIGELSGIHIIVEGGDVTLVGEVSSQVEKQKAEMLARSAPGVFQVHNELTVSS